MTPPQLRMSPPSEVEPNTTLALSDFPRTVATLGQFFDARGVPAYLVGGVVRDALLGRGMGDIDLAVGSDTGEIGPELAALLGGRPVSLDASRGIVRIVTGESQEAAIDISPLAGDIRTDLGRRDFTLDAMAVPISDLLHNEAGAPIIDPFGGRRDLAARVIRAVSPSVFEDDAGRLLRAPRLAAQLGFAISDQTAESIRRLAHLAATVSSERVRDELLNILAQRGATASLRRLDDLGLLCIVVPELGLARGVEQPKEHHWDVFGHSVETPGQVERILEATAVPGDFVTGLTPRFGDIDAYFSHVVSDGHTRLTMLKLAGLLHDIGKPAAKTVEPSGRIRFIGHHTEGATMAEAILGRLRLSGRGVDMVTRMVEYHLRPGQMAQGEDLPTPRATYRYYRDVGDVAIDTVYLNLADYVAARGPRLGEQEWAGRCRTAAHILREGNPPAPRVAEAKLIDGHDIMRTFSMEPGPAIGVLVEAVREAHATGEIDSMEEALELVKSRLDSGGASA